MIKTKHLLFIFIPTILLVGYALFIRIVQYEPLYTKNTEKQTSDLVPIFNDDPILGNKKAPLTLVAFEDFSCAACKNQSQMLDELLLNYPSKFKMVWKSLSTHNEEDANFFAFCANKQNKFSEFKQMALANYLNLKEDTLLVITEQIGLDQDKLNECLNSEAVQKYTELNKNLATAIGIQVVPTFFINNKQITTPKSLDEWKIILEL